MWVDELIDSATSAWRWVQWDLLGVQGDRGTVVLDAIELPADGSNRASDLLVTVAVVPTDTAARGIAELTETLAAWVDSDAICDVLQRIDRPGTLALFQDSQLLVLGDAA